ncbi:MAG: hypothetical protein IIC75_00365 [Bacteroidetes bacterium]|nr:hypothetical protein [Bacteroidota bacterium]
MEILEALLWFSLAVPVSIVSGILIVLFWYLVGVAFFNVFMWIKKKNYKHLRL